MPKRFLRKHLPDHTTFRDHPHLARFGHRLHDPNLWHLNRRSVAGGFAAGLFMAWVPVPFQMVLAAAAAIALRVNLPIAVVTVWVTNPVTMPPLFYLAYKVGAMLLGTRIDHVSFELSWHWLTEELRLVWQPFLLGCLVMGTASAAGGYAAARGLWRWWVVRRHRRRLARGRARE
ncbi:MAG TPA: DUF2062 domain-containing protein [Chromatiales bacterium]|nr:DUF2062 domain-containing protein [Chromatiales bacterium]